jgi:hypothetical protein
MDTFKAFALGEANRGNEMKVFDWNKAARLIKEQKVNYASAGLSGDWEYTSGNILENGEPNFDDYTYLASTWATPEIVIDGEFIDCYVMESQTEWDSGTKWPQSALDILNCSEKEADANE